MQISKTYIVLFLFFSLITGAIGQSKKSNLREQVEKIIKYDSKADVSSTPAFLLTVLDGSYTETMFFQNARELGENGFHLDEQSIFELGSISKTITSHIFLKMAEKGILKIDQSINELLPEDFRNPRLKDYTVRDIFTLNSPLPNVFQGMGFYESDATNPYELLTKADLLHLYKSYFPEHTGKNPSYGDIDFALLEVVMENVSGLEYDQLLNQYINEPLGTGFFTTSYEKKDDVVVKGINRSGVEGEAYQFKSFAGSAGVKGNMNDLEKLVRHWMNTESLRLDKNMFKLLPATWTTKLRAKDGFYLLDVGHSQYPLVTNGLTNIHHSFIGFLPKTKTAVICLSASGTSTQDLSLLVLRMINDNWRRKR